MKLIAACFVCLLAGVGVGWYWGYTRPVAKDQRKLLEEYRTVRDNFRMTDAEMADFAEHREAYLGDLKQTDELAAALALAVIVGLDRGDVEKVRKRSCDTIAYYYQFHRTDGSTNLLARIERVAATNSAVAAAISRKPE